MSDHFADEPDMSKAAFKLAFEGPLLDSGTMDVQQLGPALLAVGDLCRSGGQIVNRELGGEINVHVKANFKDGCFDISFECIQTFYETVRDLVRHEEASDAKQILEWIGLVAGATGLPGMSLLGYLKWKRGRGLENVEKVENKDGTVNYNITIEGDGNTVTLEAPVFEMSRNARVLSAQKRLTAPLKNEGYEALQVRVGEEVVHEITKSEVQRGDYDFSDADLEAEHPFEPQHFEAIVTLRAPIFDEGAKWQFWLGDQRISAEIEDQVFLRRVFLDGERFGRGDAFRVQMRLTQVLRPNGLIRNEYAVEEVGPNIIRGPQQTSFASQLSPPTDDQEPD